MKYASEYREYLMIKNKFGKFTPENLAAQDIHQLPEIINLVRHIDAGHFIGYTPSALLKYENGLNTLDGAQRASIRRKNEARIDVLEATVKALEARLTNLESPLA